MRLGLHIPDFTLEGGPAVLRVRLADVARLAEQGGFDRISVMDHVWHSHWTMATTAMKPKTKVGQRRRPRSGRIRPAS